MKLIVRTNIRARENVCIDLINNIFRCQFSQKNIANTGLMYWGRGKTAKLLALWEASQPYELHPVSLETLGLSDVGGLLRKGMPFASGLGALDSFLNGNADLAGDPLTAHPHVERNAAESDRLVSFGYQVSPDVGRRTLRTTFSFYEWDEDFRLLSRERYPVEGFASEPASQSLARMQAQDIANKMDIFAQINRKRDKFKQEMAGIQKDLAGVKEFYVNAAKNDPRRGKRGRKGGKK